MKLLKALFSVIILITLNSFSYSQSNEYKGVFKGNLIDSSKNEAIAFATISIKVEGSTTLRSTLSKEDGTFILEKLPLGKHQVSVLSVGYNKKSFEIEITESNKIVEIKNLLISAEEKSLKKVTIST